jgi:hypothetical protein
MNRLSEMSPNYTVCHTRKMVIPCHTDVFKVMFDSADVRDSPTDADADAAGWLHGLLKRVSGLGHARRVCGGVLRLR